MRFFALLIAVAGLFAVLPGTAHAATLTVSPSTGSFTTGSTFDVSILLDTEGKAVNALDVELSFPPDKLQVVSPSTGRSIIGVWTGQPQFNNAAGRIKLQGGIPGGVNVSNGLVTTLTFRVRAVGSAAVRFLDDSRVLLHDGLGTDALTRTGSGVYELVLPPPQGPTVASQTHPDQSRWYPARSVALAWAPDQAVDGYSYHISADPVDIPDDVSEGQRTSVIYKDVADGTKYFHIKAYRNGAWGGVTHFALNIDTTPPAEFPVEIIPDRRTTRRSPIIQFITTDAHSGVSHYELKIVPLGVAQAAAGDQGFFIEAQSPYVTLDLGLGDYDVIVRAYDRAGNVRESVERLEIVTALLRFVGERGLEVRGGLFTIPWAWLWTLAIVLLGVLIYLARLVRDWHDTHHLRIAAKELPPHLRKQLAELKHLRSKYGGKAIALFLLVGVFAGGAGIVHAQSAIELAPPFITTISRSISDQEIFYAGGKVDVTNAEVVIYLQNLRTGETGSHVAQSDKRGDWFYRHDQFLGSGNYLLWAQSRFGGATSPPGPQVEITVRPTALQFGASRISYESLYLILFILFLAATAGLTGYIVYHGLHGREKRKLVEKEIREAEESVRRGFAVLRRDIEAELATIKKAKLGKDLREEEHARETQLLKDLEWVEKYVGKEVWDIDRASS